MAHEFYPNEENRLERRGPPPSDLLRERPEEGGQSLYHKAEKTAQAWLYPGQHRSGELRP